MKSILLPFIPNKLKSIFTPFVPGKLRISAPSAGERESSRAGSIKSEPQLPPIPLPQTNPVVPVTAPESSGDKMWTLDEGLVIVRELKERIWQLGFAIALTGGVLYRGHSNKDLDILFYPLSSIEYPYYAFVINELDLYFKPEKFFIIDHKEQKSLKLIAVFQLKNGKRIDFFFPTISLKNRNDQFPSVYRNYPDPKNIMRTTMDQILGS